MEYFYDACGIFFELFEKYETSKEISVVSRVDNVMTFLERKVDELEDLIDEQSLDIRKYVREKSKAKACTAMKMKKSYEMQIEDLNKKIENIKFMKIKMDESLTNMKLIEAQKHTLNVIKKNMGLETVENVERHSENVEDQIEKIETMTMEITKGKLNLLFDDKALDEEYENMLVDENIDDEKEIVIEIPKTKLPVQYKVPIKKFILA